MENLEVKQLKTLQDYNYKETSVMAARTETGEWIALRPVSENLALNWSTVHRQIKAHPVFRNEASTVSARGADGKKRDMLCLSAEMFNKWLKSIDPSKHSNLDESLLEEYRDGLVLHIVRMLSKAISYIQQTEPQRLHAEILYDINSAIIEKKNKLDILMSDKKELTDEIKALESRLKDHMKVDPMQTNIDFKPLNQ